MGMWHRHHDVEVKDYAPTIFADIRRRLGVSDEAYRAAWKIPLADIQPKLGAGRSGSLFIRSTDDRYLLKTLPQHEVAALRFVLQGYHHHLIQNPESVLIRFVGLLKFTWGTRVLYLFVSNNILYQPPSLSVNHIYDLKGRVPKPGKHLRLEKLPDTVLTGRILKDNDVNRKWIVNSRAREHLLNIVEKDVRFLESNDLMDYSLLIGVHIASTPYSKSLAGLFNASEQPVNPDVLSLGGTARTFSSDNCEIFTFGIIDFLAVYGAKKWAANKLKSFLWDENQLSTVPATYYSNRLLDYAQRIITDQTKEYCKQSEKWNALPTVESGLRPIRIFFSDCAVFRKHKVETTTRTVKISPETTLKAIKEMAFARSTRGMHPAAAEALMKDAESCLLYQVQEGGRHRPSLFPLTDPDLKPYFDESFQHLMLHSKISS